MASLPDKSQQIATNIFPFLILGSLVFLLTAVSFFGLEISFDNTAKIISTREGFKINFIIDPKSQFKFQNLINQLELPMTTSSGVTVRLDENTTKNISNHLPLLVKFKIREKVIYWQAESNHKIKRSLFENLNLTNQFTVGYIEVNDTFGFLSNLIYLPKDFNYFPEDILKPQDQSIIIFKNDNKLDYLFVAKTKPDQFVKSEEINNLKQKISEDEQVKTVSQNNTQNEQIDIFNFTVELKNGSISNNYFLAQTGNQFLLSNSDTLIKETITRLKNNNSSSNLKELVEISKNQQNGSRVIFIKEPALFSESSYPFTKLKISKLLNSSLNIDQIKILTMIGNDDVKGHIILK